MNASESCIRPADIYLPAADIDLTYWAVIACDQYTSEPEYWKNVEADVQDNPSTLHLIYPEAFLRNGDARIAQIQQNMDDYLRRGVITQAVTGGGVLVVRTVKTGMRLGLVCALDLEQYDYTPGTKLPVRATEGTILSRIPPRVRIRQGACLDLPHNMVLLDDPQFQAIEPLYAARATLPLLYDFELMQGGGHLAGYAVTGAACDRVMQTLGAMQAAASGMFLAIGDGNHSLAAAKQCWEARKAQLPAAKWANDPARYALIELVNLHSPALQFHPIHRVLFHINAGDLKRALKKWLEANGMGQTEGRDAVLLAGETETAFSIRNIDKRLPIAVLQSFLDLYLLEHPSARIDYVHGEASVRELANQRGNAGLLLGSIDKSTLFPAISAGGVLPRKTFSMGEASEKRYYMESALLRQGLSCR